MKATTFQNTRNYDSSKIYKSKSEKPSETIPDRSLTIPEILKRFASGRPVNVKVYDEFTGDDDNLTGVDIRTMDLTEIHDLVAVTNKNIYTLQQEQNRRRKLQEDEALEKSIIQKYEARKKDKDRPDPEGPSKFIQLPLELKNPKNEG